MAAITLPSAPSKANVKVKAIPTWHSCLLKRPSERSSEEVSRAFSQLKEQTATEKFHPSLLHLLCSYVHYHQLDENILVIRQGEYGSNWYLVISGTLAVHLSEKARLKGVQPLCTLGAGASFGEGILTSNPHMVSVITTSKVQLLRLEFKDMKVLWEQSKGMMESAITALSNLPDLNEDMKRIVVGKDVDLLELSPNPAASICLAPSSKMIHCAWVMRAAMMVKYPHMIRDRKYHLRTYKRCMVGSELVDWVIDVFPGAETREQVVGMCQALLEEGVVLHVCREHPFLDRYLFYQFLEDSTGCWSFPTDEDVERAEEDLPDVLAALAQVAPDATLRMILRKPPEDRSQEEVEAVYQELLQIKPLQHLSYTVKRELAGVIMFEAHSRAGSILFNQGDEGRSWFIILRGSVNVSIYGKGVVCVLREGDDFGKLALINDAPRAATITLAEDNCHFLRVDKDDFNRILRDVEAYTVRLKEHGQDVLVLEKIPASADNNGSFHSEYKYSVMAGTPEKILEYLLETRLERKRENATLDPLLEDFLLTHSVFLPDDKLCTAIKKHYQVSFSSRDKQSDADFVLSHKKCVVNFVLAWYDLDPDAFTESTCLNSLLETLTKAVGQDCAAHPGLISQHEALLLITNTRKGSLASKLPKKKSLFSSRKTQTKTVVTEGGPEKKGIIRATDEYIFKVFCADHTYTTIRLPICSSVRDIVHSARDKLCLGHDPVLCEVKSNGERLMFRESDKCIIKSLSLNGRLFIAPREHVDALTPVPEQEGPSSGSLAQLEVLSTRELAYQMTLLDWDLFLAVPEQEILNKVFGPIVFPDGIFPNLENFLRRYEQLQYWVVTEMVLVSHLGKRVQLLRKLIKLAQHLKEQNNFHAFFAVISGLSHLAVSRLSQTWEKMPGKLKKMFSEFEMLLEPARNHRPYRLALSRLASPIIPYVQLLIKDLTFTDEGNKTYYDNMVNFEKMHMVAQTLKTLRFCRQSPLDAELPDAAKSASDIKNYVRNLQVIDNQRTLTNLSHKCEPRKG